MPSVELHLIEVTGRDGLPAVNLRAVRIARRFRPVSFAGAAMLFLIGFFR